MIWLTFVCGAVVIVLAGTRLSRYGDEIAELTGLGRLWIGVVLVAGATSLPPFFSELPKWFFNSLPGSRGRIRCCSELFEQQSQECGVLHPYSLLTVAKCPPVSQ